jgi:hypothetical protein
MDAERLEAIKVRLLKAAQTERILRISGMDDPSSLVGDAVALYQEVERLTAENQRLTSELNLARGRFEGAVMAAGWERAATGERL